MDNVKGLAMTNGDVPIAAVTLERAHSGSPERFAIMTLDRTQGAWSALSVPGMPSMSGKALLGGSGNTLAIWDGVSKLVSFFTAN